MLISLALYILIVVCSVALGIYQNEYNSMDYYEKYYYVRPINFSYAICFCYVCFLFCFIRSLIKAKGYLKENKYYYSIQNILYSLYIHIVSTLVISLIIATKIFSGEITIAIVLVYTCMNLLFYIYWFFNFIRFYFFILK